MEPGKIINATGLIIDIVGAFIMFWNTPKVTSYVFGYGAAEPNRFEFKNKRIRLGMILLVIGFCCQLVATFID